MALFPIFTPFLVKFFREKSIFGFNLIEAKSLKYLHALAGALVSFNICYVKGSGCSFTWCGCILKKVAVKFGVWR
jgi:hypothetical protein